MELTLIIIRFWYPQSGWSTQQYHMIPIFYVEIYISIPWASFSWEHPPIAIPLMWQDYYLVGQVRILPAEATVIDEGELIEYVKHIQPRNGLE